MNEKKKDGNGPFIAPDRAPQTPNEWGLLAVFSFFFALFLLLELAQDFTPAKLSVPFFLLSYLHGVRQFRGILAGPPEIHR